MKNQTIGKLAAATGIGIETIRFYEREGLLEPPLRTPANYRLYPPEAESRLRFILRAKALGFALAEIRELLRLQKGGSRSEVREVAGRHLADVRAKLVSLRAIEVVLDELVADCDGCGDASEGCPIIESIASSAGYELPADAGEQQPGESV